MRNASRQGRHSRVEPVRTIHSTASMNMPLSRPDEPRVVVADDVPRHALRLIVPQAQTVHNSRGRLQKRQPRSDLLIPGLPSIRTAQAFISGHRL